MNRHSYDSRESGVCEVTASHPEAVAQARATLPGPEVSASMASIFGALADPTRLRILLALRSNELCVCDLVELTGVTQSAVSHQLKVLRDLQLVTFRREGKLVRYRLADDHVASLVDVAAEHAVEIGGETGA